MLFCFCLYFFYYLILYGAEEIWKKLVKVVMDCRKRVAYLHEIMYNIIHIYEHLIGGMENHGRNHANHDHDDRVHGCGHCHWHRIRAKGKQKF